MFFHGNPRGWGGNGNPEAISKTGAGEVAVGFGGNDGVEMGGRQVVRALGGDSEDRGRPGGNLILLGFGGGGSNGLRRNISRIFSALGFSRGGGKFFGVLLRLFGENHPPNHQSKSSVQSSIGVSKPSRMDSRIPGMLSRKRVS